MDTENTPSGIETSTRGPNPLIDGATIANILSAALEYAARGWRVFPLRPGQKTPLIKEWPLRATCDEELIRRWWRKYPSANIAAVTGEHFTVLDVDVKNGLDGKESLKSLLRRNGSAWPPELPIVKTPSGGLHIYFRYVPDVRNSASTIGRGLDVRGEGGYVVMPPSVIAQGTYAWNKRGDLAQAPLWLVDAMRSPPPATDGVVPIPMHARNDTLFRTAIRIAKGGVLLDEVENTIKHANAARCVEPLPETEVRAIARSAMKYAPPEVRADAAPSSELIAAAINRLSVDAGALFEHQILELLRTLRREDRAEFARTRARVKETKRVSMPEFDSLVGDVTNQSEDGMFPRVTASTDAVDGAQLLTDIVETIKSYVVADEATLRATALWILHTWLMDAATISPIANITAPEKRCGKSVLLTAIEKLVYRPLRVANIAPAAIFRSVELWRPTLLIDEVDAWLRDNEEARGILNAGVARDGAYVVRCVGDDFTPTRFSIWSPKALCGIGSLAATLADRSIPLRLRRKRLGELTDNIRRADPKVWETLHARIARWTQDYETEIAAVRAEPIEGLNDRANDCWEILLAVAEIAGGVWPEQARKAAIELHASRDEEPDAEIRLLRDIREIFVRKSMDRIFNGDLHRALVSDPEAPWGSWNRGKEITAHQMAKRLREFDIASHSVRIGSQAKRGYLLEDFADAFERYLPAKVLLKTGTSAQAYDGPSSAAPTDIAAPDPQFVPGRSRTSNGSR